jgi:hypothetical protein
MLELIVNAMQRDGQAHQPLHQLPLINVQAWVVFRSRLETDFAILVATTQHVYLTAVTVSVVAPKDAPAPVKATVTLHPISVFAFLDSQGRHVKNVTLRSCVLLVENVNSMKQGYSALAHASKAGLALVAKHSTPWLASKA